jgi:hypothetical protein
LWPRCEAITSKARQTVFIDPVGRSFLALSHAVNDHATTAVRRGDDTLGKIGLGEAFCG